MKYKTALKVILMSLSISLSAHSSDTVLRTAPDFDNYIQQRYEGDSLKQQLSNAGAIFKDQDIIKFDSKKAIIYLQSDDKNISLVRNLIEEQGKLTPRHADSQIVRKVLVRQAWDFSAIQHSEHKTLSTVKFNSDGNAKGNNDRVYRWAVTKNGIIEFRDQKGDLIISAFLDAQGRIVVDRTGNQLKIILQPKQS